MIFYKNDIFFIKKGDEYALPMLPRSDELRSKLERCHRDLIKLNGII